MFPPGLLCRSLSPTSLGTPTTSENALEASTKVRLAAAHLSRFRLSWPADRPPHRFLIVHKEFGQEQLENYIYELITWLLTGCPVSGGKCTVYLSNHFIQTFLAEHRGFDQWLSHGNIKDSSHITANSVDLIFTMGGDGTVLNAAWMFQQTVPPIMTFHFGTVGFLSMFDFANFRQTVQKVITEGTRVNIRMRLHCQIIKRKAEDAEEDSIPGRIKFECEAMNEVVVGRGTSPGMALIDLFGDGDYLTSVLADGLIIATTTGSTAYSMAAGGSVVHPDVPAIMVTPICPHTLSLRPFIVPDSMELSLRLNKESRSAVWASFDGRHMEELGFGDELQVSCSKFPVTTVCRKAQTKDWFDGLSHCLHWNERPGKQAS